MTAFEQELAAFTSKISSVRRLAKDCVQAIVVSPDDDMKYLMAERLPALGTVVLPDLLEVLDETSHPRTVRYLAAWVALILGERTRSVGFLRFEVAQRSEWSLPAANALGRYRISEAQVEISEALDRVSLDPDNPETAQYSAALREVGGVIDPATRGRIVNRNSSWIARAVRADFPEESS
jgi:hypothetical protein